MNLRYRVTLSAEERTTLENLVSGGKGRVRRLKRAQILLAADAGGVAETIALNVAVSTSTVYRTKQRFVEEGLEEALSEEPRPGAERKLSGSEEALLVATACSKPPGGRASWTMELLADEMVRLTKHETLSSETVRRRLAEKERTCSAATVGLVRLGMIRGDRRPRATVGQPSPARRKWLASSRAMTSARCEVTAQFAGANSSRSARLACHADIRQKTSRR